MFACPNCQTRLTKQPSPEGPRWLCGACGGRAVHLPSLRCTPAGGFVRRLWALARSVPAADCKRPCPVCERSMATVPTIAARGSTEALRLDLCTSCQFVWFDPTEHEAWERSTSLAATDSWLPAETRAALARIPGEEPLVFESDESPPLFAVLPRDESFELKYLICVLGFPVEVDPPPLHRRPLATWTLIGLVTAVSAYAWQFMPGAPLEWGFVPAEMWRHGGLTLVTSFFLHGGLLHLLGNMYFLAVFGDNVEDLLGWRRYLVLLLAATVAGHLFQAGAQMMPRIPGIGASGGVAGVIVYYGLTFPHGRLRLFRVALVDVSVWGALALWVGIQVISMIVQPADGVGYAAHVGGALAGLVFWFLNRGQPAGIVSLAGRS